MAEVALADLPPLGAELRDGRGDDRALQVAEAEAAQREQVRELRAQLVGGRLAHGREAPVLGQLGRRRTCRSGSACCRRRRRGAWASIACDGSEREAAHRLAAAVCSSVPHTLYVIHGSHPCVAAERALQLKGQPYRIHEMAPALHVPEQWLRFRKQTVPALVLGNGEQIVGSRAIVHRLDSSCPSRALLPEDPAARAARRRGGAVGRRGAPAGRRAGSSGPASAPRPDAIASYAEGSRLPLPAFVQRLAAPRIARVARWRNRGGEEQARKDLAALPGQLDQVDALDRRGRAWAAPSRTPPTCRSRRASRLLATMDDVLPLLEGRPCLALARRLFPSYAGRPAPAGAAARS